MFKGHEHKVLGISVADGCARSLQSHTKYSGGGENSSVTTTFYTTFDLEELTVRLITSEPPYVNEGDRIVAVGRRTGTILESVSFMNVTNRTCQIAATWSEVLFQTLVLLVLLFLTSQFGGETLDGAGAFVVLLFLGLVVYVGYGICCSLNNFRLNAALKIYLRNNGLPKIQASLGSKVFLVVLALSALAHWFEDAAVPLGPEHARYMDEGRFSKVRAGMGRVQVEAILGPVKPANIRAFEEKAMFGWFYPTSDGGAAGVYFEERAKGDGVWIVKIADFEAVKGRERESDYRKSLPEWARRRFLELEQSTNVP